MPSTKEQCRNCNKTFESGKEFENHVKDCTSKEQFTCECERSFKTQKEYDNHTKSCKVSQRMKAAIETAVAAAKAEWDKEHGEPKQRKKTEKKEKGLSILGLAREAVEEVSEEESDAESSLDASSDEEEQMAILPRKSANKIEKARDTPKARVAEGIEDIGQPGIHKVTSAATTAMWATKGAVQRTKQVNLRLALTKGVNPGELPCYWVYPKKYAHFRAMLQSEITIHPVETKALKTQYYALLNKYSQWEKIFEGDVVLEDDDLCPLLIFNREVALFLASIRFPNTPITIVDEQVEKHIGTAINDLDLYQHRLVAAAGKAALAQVISSLTTQEREFQRKRHEKKNTHQKKNGGGRQ